MSVGKTRCALGVRRRLRREQILYDKRWAGLREILLEDQEIPVPLLCHVIGLFSCVSSICIPFSVFSSRFCGKMPFNETSVILHFPRRFIERMTCGTDC